MKSRVIEIKYESYQDEHIETCLIQDGIGETRTTLVGSRIGSVAMSHGFTS